MRTSGLFRRCRSTIRTQKGFIVTFTIEEGPRYRFGTVEIRSNVAGGRSAGAATARLRASAGAVYNAEAVEKSVENLSIEVARRGYPFAVVRPRGDRDLATATINVAFVVDDGPRVYIERINIRGNTRTRDYVIRREFDIAEGDAYNRALIDRAERRLKNLNYFKSVKITNEPGSAPDRIVINVDVEEKPTGELSVAGGYSTADGFMAELSVGERNLLGQGQYAKLAVQYGQRARGFELSYAEPYFLGYRLCGRRRPLSPSRRWPRTISPTTADRRRRRAHRLCAERGASLQAALQHLPAGNHAAGRF